jgi:hypothetical protein
MGLSSVAEHLRKAPPYSILIDGDVQSCVTKVMKLTCRKLLCQDDWSDWQKSKFLQLDQYHAQNMFGKPTPASDGDAIF